MSSFVRLVQNEHMKIYTRLRTWVMLAILALAVITMGVLMKYVLEAGMDHVLQFMVFASSLTSLVTIFTVIVAGDIVAAEFTWGTIKLLLIRPSSRGKILWSKYVTVLLFIVTLLLVLLIVSYFTGLLLFGVGGIVLPDETISSILKTYGLKSIQIVMTATLAFMISTVFRSSSLAIGLSIFLMLTSMPTMAVLVQLRYTWVKYVLFANTDLSPYVLGGNPLVPGMTLGFSVTVLLAYWIVFYAVSWLLFTKRDVAGS
ncbi:MULTISPECIES: ABC transporter permease [unclassified Paenibacillus]|uniref:ABC transporter permease n=1 Tax=unclassified Paenibacillus TaxID=185978 RepID=UPI001AE4B4AD|nr:MULTISPECIES: ABC transporter permease [unclassified Paenibacillus]MBP1156862.1 ABC-2 type transport system permease protein [Paenibacillus sp. PvP091]MBP1172399.1 ABC-2 type transport system permease protein [Paenibacillus sp. PvR098]MBP2438780.1 ABC-2 type transport system permease protein [Paenibacillus sp. PvP052]